MQLKLVLNKREICFRNLIFSHSVLNESLYFMAHICSEKRLQLQIT